MPAKADEIDGRAYAISHAWQNTPIHLVGFRLGLDEKKAGVAGAARTSPHGLLQEYLNRDKGKVWGFVSNGLKLRILRDNVSLTRQAYVEFDIENILETESFSDFSLLWLLCHESRVESDDLLKCWLEKWTEFAREQGTRALDALRAGVEAAISALGEGFLATKENDKLREQLRTRDLPVDDFYRQLLRLVYRLIFLFVSEDRGILLIPEAGQLEKDRYLKHYSTTRLRELARRGRATEHTDLYEQLRLIFRGLGSDKGIPELALPALGSFLWSETSIPHLDGALLQNRFLLTALRSLCTIKDEESRTRRTVDFRNLGSEELGSVYESLLELQPYFTDAGEFELRVAAGNERKTSGSYYTPTGLINSLLDTALEPVVAEAMRQDKNECAILDLKVCDPACGSGHFLIAAAHRLAKHLARIRSGDEEPSPEITRHALRDVVGHCLYGVDINPMAVELCKVSLWLEAMNSGYPLSFLEHRILCGNSLFGATPTALAAGIPDAAIQPIQGDDSKFCAALRKRNKNERESFRQTTMFRGLEAWDKIGNLAAWINTLDDIDDGSIEGLKKKQELYQQQVTGSSYLTSKFLPDAWCAAFVWDRSDNKREALTEGAFREIEKNPNAVSKSLRSQIERIAAKNQFFHWHVAFPSVFRIPSQDETPENKAQGWSGGFDVVLGNPPWERIKIQEKEWFSQKSPEIAAAPNSAARERLISALAAADSPLHEEFLAECRLAEGQSHFLRNSGRYPLCGRGDVNTYTVFAETMRSIVSNRGRVGCIVPSGIATDDTTKLFFQDLIESRSLRSLFDFENREGIFPGVHRSYKFCLLTASAPQGHDSPPAEFIFFAQGIRDLLDSERRFALTSSDIALVNPNTRTCPIFRTRRDAELTRSVYRHLPVMIKELPDKPDENAWGIFYLRLIHYGDHATELKMATQCESDGFALDGNIYLAGRNRRLPVYESKLIHQFDYLFGTYDRAGLVRAVTDSEKSDENFRVQTRYWVSEEFFESVLKKYDYKKSWFLCYRDVARTTDERTVVSAIIPRYPASIKLPILGFDAARPAHLLVANLNAFVFDYIARQKVGGISLSFFILKQLPIVPPSAYLSEVPWARGTTFVEWISKLVSRLICVGPELRPLQTELGVTDSGEMTPSVRLALRCQLDAAFFHLYAISRNDLDYIMETFPIIRRHDEETYGEYRTKQMILDFYDEYAASNR